MFINLINMICGEYRNNSFQGLVSVHKSELENLVCAEVIRKIHFSHIDSNQNIALLLSSHDLIVDGFKYPIAASKKTPLGDFVVLEKWMNPYWRKGDSVYLPSKDSPVGEYLIILADAYSFKKTPYSIHSWPSTINKGFSRGNHTTGCIRLRREDMKEAYFRIELGAKVRIEK